MTKLLDDPDDVVFSHIQDRFITVGKEAVPLLERVWKESKNALVQLRIENIIEKINFNVILDEFNLWKSLENPEIADGLTIINRIQYPNFNPRLIYLNLEQYSREIWLELNENLTTFELINVVNKVVFELWSFKSVHDSDSDAFQYNFMSNLIEMRCGNMFTTSLFYLLIAERNELPFMPVLLEDQLILAGVRELKKSSEMSADDVLFYVNPYERGVVFDDLSIRKWILKHELEDKESYFLPCDNKEVMRVYLNRLIQGYEENGESSKAGFLRDILSTFSEGS